MAFSIETPLILVDIDNFWEVLPKWDETTKTPQRYGIVDMGSNGIRFTVAQINPINPHIFTYLHKERSPISIYDALNCSTTIPPSIADDVITAIVETVRRFVGIARAYNVPLANISILATAGTRAAGNSGALTSAIYAACDVGVYVLAPEVETLFGAVMGCKSSVNITKGSLLLDLGGGSVQMAWIEPVKGDVTFPMVAAKAGRSLPFGAARLSKILEDTKDDETRRTTAIGSLTNDFQQAFSELRDAFPALQQAALESDGLDIYMCGGGFRGYGRMLMYDHGKGEGSYPITTIANFHVEGKEFSQVKRMRNLAETVTGKIIGLSKRRRAQFPAIAEVVEALVKTVGSDHIRRVTFCEGGNREGCLLMKLPARYWDGSLLHHREESVEETSRGGLRIHGPGVSPEKTPKKFAKTNHLWNILLTQNWKDNTFDSEYNASLALMQATTGLHEEVMLTHKERAMLAVAGVARWGNKVLPKDKPTFKATRKLLSNEDEFWALWYGCVMRAFAHLVPFANESADVEKILRFSWKWNTAANTLVGGMTLEFQIEPTLYKTSDVNVLQSWFDEVRVPLEKEACGPIIVSLGKLLE